ncbi:MAG: hypothetical protein II942_01100 [Alphaproteobacteria bacterium]|nr:hypothetical protein [Alphaproteobacteria bacterium]
MKHWLLNLILPIVALSIGIGLFLMKQRVVEYEKELASLRRTILADQREIHTLKADWAVLTEPSRLRHLLAQSAVQQIQVKQVVKPDEVALKPVPVPSKKPFEEIKDETPTTEETDVLP